MTTKKPLPQDYGLDNNAHIQLANLKKEMVKKERTKLFVIAMGLLAIIIFSFAELGDVAKAFAGWLCLPVFGCLIGIPQADGSHELKKTTLYQNFTKYAHDLERYNNHRKMMMFDYWDNLSGHQFEQAFAEACRLQGYSAAVSKAGGDGGIDLILKKDGREIVVQCKAHNKKIGPAPVRDLYGVMAANGYKEGWVVSKNGFSDNAQAFAKGKPIRLIDIDTVIRFAGKGFYGRYGIKDDESVKETQNSYENYKAEKNKAETMALESKPAYTKTTATNTNLSKPDNCKASPNNEKNYKKERAESIKSILKYFAIGLVFAAIAYYGATINSIILMFAVMPATIFILMALILLFFIP